MTEREINIYCARVYLREAARRRGTSFYWTLLAWAANRRRAAKALGEQMELFSV